MLTVKTPSFQLRYKRAEKHSAEQNYLLSFHCSLVFTRRRTHRHKKLGHEWEHVFQQLATVNPTETSELILY